MFPITIVTQHCSQTTCKMSVMLTNTVIEGLSVWVTSMTAKTARPLQPCSDGGLQHVVTINAATSRRRN